MVAAAKAGKTDEVDILKLVLASLKNAKIDKSDGSDLSEEEEVQVVFSEAKKVKDSIEKFEEGGRDELAAREKEQLKVIEKYLPEQAGQDEVRKIVQKIIEDTGASNMSQMGMVMGASMKELQGKADGKVVSEVVKELLS